MDADDSDPATFFHFLSAAVERSVVNTNRKAHRASLPEVSPDDLRDLTALARRWLRWLLESHADAAPVTLMRWYEIKILCKNLCGDYIDALADVAAARELDIPDE